MDAKVTFDGEELGEATEKEVTFDSVNLGMIFYHGCNHAVHLESKIITIDEPGICPGCKRILTMMNRSEP